MMKQHENYFKTTRNMRQQSKTVASTKRTIRAKSELIIAGKDDENMPPVIIKNWSNDHDTIKWVDGGHNICAKPTNEIIQIVTEFLLC